MQRIANGVWKVRYGEPEQHTPVTLGQKGIQYNALEQLQCEGKSPIANTDISVRMTSRGTVVELPLRHDEEIYGFGLQFYRLKQTGRKRVIRVNSDPIADTGDSHAPVPFYISTAGYGVFIDTSRYATFYCGTNLPKGASRRKTSSEGELGTSEKELYDHQARGISAYWLMYPVQRALIFICSKALQSKQRFNAIIYFLVAGAFHHFGAWGCGIAFIRQQMKAIPNDWLRCFARSVCL
jgi:alpha-D-xyloside xylohydrolase